MNFKQAMQVIPLAIKHRIVPYLHGSQGIGKTDLITQIADSMGVDLIHLHLSTQEVGDLIGLQVRNADGTTSHCRPKWLPTEGRGIIFLDEFNRAHQDVLQAMFPFLLTGCIHTHKIGGDWRIVAAGNYSNDAFNVTDTSDAALMSRFLHIDFKPEVSEFVEYLEGKNEELAADWVKAHPEMLRSQGKFDFSMVKPDRRSIDKFLIPMSKEKLDPDVKIEVYQGCVGTSAAASFAAWETKQEESLKVKDILENYSKVKQRVIELSNSGKESRLDILGAVVDEFVAKLKDKPDTLIASDKKVSNLVAFIGDIPLEMAMKLFKKLDEFPFKNRLKITNNVELMQKISKRHEAKQV